jgi:hypothetical protein
MRRLATIIACVAWLGGIVAGMRKMAEYEATAGRAAAAPSSWPSGTRVMRGGARPTLLLFAHPHCPCTRSSIAELASLVTRVGPRAAITVLFYKPSTFGPGWERSDLWRSAEAIPGATVLCDVDGVEAHRFGAATSGQALFYDAAGRVLFRGGITGARGQLGDNAGIRAIASLLTSGSAACSTTPVYGCSLLGGAAGRE